MNRKRKSKIEVNKIEDSADNKHKIVKLILLMLICTPIIFKSTELVLLRFYGHCTDAVITSTLDQINPRYSKACYCFSFNVGGKEYLGNTNVDDPRFIGKIIRVVYLDFAPSINIRKSYFDEAEVSCHCE